MQAVRLHTEADRRHPRLQWDTVDEPRPGINEVLIRVNACGVCGSDVHCSQVAPDGRIRYSGPIHSPVILGHEFTGTVVAVGPGVSAFRSGDLVVCEGMIGCGVCRSCRDGHPNQCPRLKLLGLSRDGAFADCIVVPERYCWSLNGLAEALGSEERACELGCLIEPISSSYNGVFVTGGGFLPGGHVVIYGAGPIGLGAIGVLRLAGAATITVFEPVAARRHLAEQLGADAALDPGGAGLDLPGLVRQITRGHGADLQVECAGAIGSLMPHIQQCFAPGGTLLYLARTGESATVALDGLVTGANRIVCSRGHVGGGCFPRIIVLLENQRLKVDAMITARYAFARTLDAIRKASELTEGKVLVSQSQT